jgi:hypothetical protein
MAEDGFGELMVSGLIVDFWLRLERHLVTGRLVIDKPKTPVRRHVAGTKNLAGHLHFNCLAGYLIFWL